MSDKQPKPVISRYQPHASMRNYLLGFLLSLSLTLLAYAAVVNELFARNMLITFIIGLALIQFFVQLFYFLHLGQEDKPRWKLFVFSFMVLVVLILVIGSLWIMNNLNYHMMPEDMNHYMQEQEGF